MKSYILDNVFKNPVFWLNSVEWFWGLNFMSGRKTFLHSSTDSHGGLFVNIGWCSIIFYFTSRSVVVHARIYQQPRRSWEVV